MQGFSDAREIQMRREFEAERQAHEETRRAQAEERRAARRAERELREQRRALRRWERYYPGVELAPGDSSSSSSGENHGEDQFYMQERSGGSGHE